MTAGCKKHPCACGLIIRRNTFMKIGIIGGTGLEKLDLFTYSEEIDLTTEFGKPSSKIKKVVSGTKELFLVSRHGVNHTISPTKVNNRANIRAFEKLGVELIIATTACGSLRQEIGVGDLVVPDQFIDFTRHRSITFFDSFEESGMQHVAMPDPFDENIRRAIYENAYVREEKIHKAATVITIEGPRFSTRAESRMFRAWGADIINMSTAPEVILANEKGIPYGAFAISTDYDSWKKDEKHATMDEILKVFRGRVETVKSLLADIVMSL